MISPDELVTLVVARLKAYGPLVAAIPAADAIKEQNWKGTAFDYPAVRVDRPTLMPLGNGNCAARDSRATINVTAYSVKDSTITAQRLQGLILDALDGRTLESAALVTTAFRPQVVQPVVPSGEGWQGPMTFQTLVKPK